MLDVYTEGENHDVTFGVSTVGNLRGLCMCLTSVLSAEYVPKHVQILAQGEYPNVNDFYFEQLLALARVKDVEVSFHFSKPLGYRRACDWHFDNCKTPYLWMGDDDVVFSPNCLYAYTTSYLKVNRDFTFLAGTKVDVNNRRGYSDFSLAPRVKSDLQGNGLDRTIFPYVNIEYDYSVPVFLFDTGNCLFDVEKIRDKKIKMNAFIHSGSTNCAGPEIIMAAALDHHGLKGRLVPSAMSWHLEKEKVEQFTEMPARIEMVVRSCELLGYKCVGWIKTIFQHV